LSYFIIRQIGFDNYEYVSLEELCIFVCALTLQKQKGAFETRVDQISPRVYADGTVMHKKWRNSANSE
jgi:hypothetical protein